MIFLDVGFQVSFFLFVCIKIFVDDVVFICICNIYNFLLFCLVDCRCEWCHLFILRGWVLLLCFLVWVLHSCSLKSIRLFVKTGRKCLLLWKLLENFILHWVLCVIGSAICGDFLIDVRQMRMPFLLKKALSCYLVFWIPSPCLGTGFSGSVFCSCLNFPSTFVYLLSTYVFCFFCVFISVFSVVWVLMRVEWVGGCFMMLCVLFFFVCLFFF